MLDDADLNALEAFFPQSVPALDRTFRRSQDGRDLEYGIAEVVSERHQGGVAAALHFANQNLFLKKFLNCAFQDRLIDDEGERSRRFVDAIARHFSVFENYLPHVVVTNSGDGQEGPNIDTGVLWGILRDVPRYICRIESQGTPFGTGLLVGPDLVLTAAHVIQDVFDGQAFTKPIGKEEFTKPIGVRFDVLSSNPQGGGPYIPIDTLIDADVTRAFPQQPDDDIDQLQIGEEDVALLRLAEAPGHRRGWLDLSRAQPPVAGGHNSVVCFSHPLAGDQRTSFGLVPRTLPQRFHHTCVCLGGSSGGGILNGNARLVGVHHGRVLGSDPATFIAGGGQLLARWGAEHATVPTGVVPVWEVLRSGGAGTGYPIIGMERILSAVLREQEAAGANFGLRMSGRDEGSEPTPPEATNGVQGARQRVWVANLNHTASRVLCDALPETLPADKAIVVPIHRAVLHDVFRVAAERFALPGSSGFVCEILKLLADRVTPAPLEGDIGENFTTDIKRALSFETLLNDRYGSLPSNKLVWTVVQISTLKLDGEMSEALAHLYRAALSVPGDRGRLVITGSDRAIADVVRDILKDRSDIGVEIWEGDPLTTENLSSFLHRFLKGASGGVAPAFKRLVEGFLEKPDFFLDHLQSQAAASNRTPYEELIAFLAKYHAKGLMLEAVS
ncbi:trypsin-like serine peptidase [Asticcacaulis machinosus]|uniref:Serine protease n=1 Tax=Asticcacaulis machinosus TaxID=2984211 RepID=A0ABT5HGM6_9CAUL|nr:trypsin-like peptidase domain-containing protein [Asticcacaulis machinosus]MDC7675143.1 trypsin-like peptidase domain-containing protein [Asticcacaulis machinosus]